MATRGRAVMDADGHGIIVGVVGFSMAFMGFVMSLIAPIVQNFYPRTQAQLPALITAHEGQRHIRRRIVQSTVSQTDKAQNRVSPAGSADSVATAASTATSTSTATTSVPSEPNLQEDTEITVFESTVKGKDAKAATSSSPCTPRACIARVARMRPKSRSRPKRADSAQSAASGSLSDPSGVPQGQVSYGQMTDSPASSTLNLTARSSSEIDVNFVLAPSSPTHPYPSDVSGKEVSKDSNRPRPRPLIRAKTFFNLGRSSSKRPKDGLPSPPPAEHPPLHPSRAATIDESTITTTTSPTKSRLSRHLPFPSTQSSYEKISKEKANLDEEGVMQARMPHVKSLPSSQSAKAKDIARNSLDTPPLPPHNPPTLANPAIAHVSRPDEVVPTRRRICSRTRSERPISLCSHSSNDGPSTSKKQSKKSSSPPRRTRPYEAPYFFPMPNSPDAVNYAQRTRSEYAQAHLGSDQERNANVNARQDVTSIADKSTVKEVSSTPEPKTAPAHRIGFHFPLHFHRSHTRAASLSSPTSPPRSPDDEARGVDEFGFVRPVQEMRVRKSHDETVPKNAIGIARSITMSEGIPSEGPPLVSRPTVPSRGASR